MDEIERKIESVESRLDERIRALENTVIAATERHSYMERQLESLSKAIDKRFDRLDNGVAEIWKFTRWILGAFLIAAAAYSVNWVMRGGMTIVP